MSRKVSHLHNQHKYLCAAIAYALVNSRCFTAKQIDLTSVFVTIQLPYCVSMLLLTVRCKSAPAQYYHTNVIIIWHLHKAFQENKLRLN